MSNSVESRAILMNQKMEGVHSWEVVTKGQDTSLVYYWEKFVCLQGIA